VRVLVVGCNHRTAPLQVRERLAFDRQSARTALLELAERYPDAEFVLLSTCNRVELYAAADNADRVPGPNQLAQFLSDTRGLRLADFESTLYRYFDCDAIQHLFEVAASLDSMVPGEGQILSQVKQSYGDAKAAGITGPVMNILFQRAIAVAKKIHTNTAIAQKKVSVSSVAVDFACEIFDPDHFPEKTVLIIGAGKMGELTLEHLRQLGPGKILVTNRSRARAEELAAKFNGLPVPFAELERWLAEADLIVSSTGSPQPIVDKERFARVMQMRANSPVFIIDIAVPRDFAPEVGELENVYLYNIDDLERQRQLNLAERKKEVEKGKAIARREAETTYRELEYRRQSGPVISQLRQEWDRIRQAELEKLFNRCPDLTDEQKQAVAKCLERFQNQLLHQPLSALRDAAENGAPHGLLQALKKLFHLS